MKRHLKTFCGLLLAMGWMTSPALAAPAAPEEEHELHELIVLLEAGPGTPAAAEVADRSRRGLDLPGGLGIGNPLKADVLLSRRARGRLRERIQAEPDSPRARLERTVVLRYPPVVNLDAIEAALQRNPHVLKVERNRLFYPSAIPSDPLFSPPPISFSPFDYQWGSHLLQLPAAWDYTKGHAYVGVIDTGIDPDHPDLQALRFQNGSWSYLGGNFRPHLSYDYRYDEPDVDEKQTQTLNGITYTSERGGHGTHVAGIIAATADNGIGVAGACWNCSLMIAQAQNLISEGIPQSAVVDALTGLTDMGTQLVNMSLGGSGVPDCTLSNPGSYCDALAYANEHDLILVAASGNDGRAAVDFPAAHPDVVAVGGVIPGGAFWNACDPNIDSTDCPSNYGIDQELVAPARGVLSTFHLDLPGNGPGCDDRFGAGGLGYGPCSGTSMATPYVTGSAGLIRSVNPLLSQAQVRHILNSRASNSGVRDSVTGYGVPNVSASVQAALGISGGVPIVNRLTPFFSLYSWIAEDSLYTTVPQMAAAASRESAFYSSQGPDVPGYGDFPGEECTVSGCPPSAGASVYVFTGFRSPNGHELVPLYRMTYRGATATNPNNRDTTYTTEPAGILAFKNEGYELDGLEGYIYKKCTPEPACMPPGTVRLLRRYDPQRGDFAIFPETELAQMPSYDPPSGVSGVLGYVYLNADADGDTVINGFETLAGTDPSVADSDCDGATDGQELLVFGANGYGDPAQGPCGTIIFADVGPSYWARPFIEAIYAAGITAGCAANPLRYCPADAVTRAQISVFLLRAQGGTSYMPPPANCAAPIFADVPCTHWAAAWIEELARRGITGGCAANPLRYCPENPVTRAQMSVFLLATKEGNGYAPPPANCSSPRFTDVPCTHWAAAWIEELARRGITAGCGGGQYCPDNVVSRDQMAVFLMATFNIPFR